MPTDSGIQTGSEQLNKVVKLESTNGLKRAFVLQTVPNQWLHLAIIFQAQCQLEIKLFLKDKAAEYLSFSKLSYERARPHEKLKHAAKGLLGCKLRGWGSDRRIRGRKEGRSQKDREFLGLSRKQQPWRPQVKRKPAA